MGKHKSAPCGWRAGTGRGERHAKATRAPTVATHRAADKAAGGPAPSPDLPSTDRRETAEGYQGVIVSDGGVRVAVCREGRQWLLQRRRPRKAAVGAAWDTLAYCVTRAALMRLHRAQTGRDEPALADLPERIGAPRAPRTRGRRQGEGRS